MADDVARGDRRARAGTQARRSPRCAPTPRMSCATSSRGERSRSRRARVGSAARARPAASAPTRSLAVRVAPPVRGRGIREEAARRRPRPTRGSPPLCVTQRDRRRAEFSGRLLTHGKPGEDARRSSRRLLAARDVGASAIDYRRRAAQRPAPLCAQFSLDARARRSRRGHAEARAASYAPVDRGLASRNRRRRRSRAAGKRDATAPSRRAHRALQHRGPPTLVLYRHGAAARGARSRQRKPRRELVACVEQRGELRATPAAPRLGDVVAQGGRRVGVGARRQGVVRRASRRAVERALRASAASCSPRRPRDRRPASSAARSARRRDGRVSVASGAAPRGSGEARAARAPGEAARRRGRHAASRAGCARAPRRVYGAG